MSGRVAVSLAIAVRLRSLRTSMGVTQQTVAAAIGVRVETISTWESGSRTPSVEHVRALAEAYCSTAGWIIDGTGAMARSNLG